MTIDSMPDNRKSDPNDSVDLDNQLHSSNKQDSEQQTKVRKRIDELLEAKRLRELLDDSEDW